MTKKIIIGTVAFLILAYSLQVGFAPKYKMEELELRLVEDGNERAGTFDSLYAAPEFKDLIKEKAFKSALNELAAEDSIGLIINLKDSTVNLSIKGVIIHTNKVKRIKTDPLFTSLSSEMIDGLFSQPLKMIAERTTIVKEPIVVRQAPKDTVEAALNTYKPDTLIQHPAFLQMTLDYGIKLNFDQEENVTWTDHWVGFKFASSGWISRTEERIFCFLTFQKQTYEPSISIDLPVNDLRAIYRALPGQPYVVLGL